MARKTANVVLGTCFGVPGLTVDTHVVRVTRRLGLTTETDPVKVERALMELIPREGVDAHSHRVHRARPRGVRRAPPAVRSVCAAPGVPVPRLARRAREEEARVTRVVHRGRSIVVQVERAELPGGKSVELDIVRHPGAAAVVPFESDDVVLPIRPVPPCRRRHDLGGAPRQARRRGARGVRRARARRRGGAPRRPPGAARRDPPPRRASRTRCIHLFAAFELSPRCRSASSTTR